MKRFLLALSLALYVAPALAYYSVLDTGEVMAPNRFKLTGETQILTESGGANFSGRFDSGFNEELGFRGLVGVGRTDVFLGAMLKWAPVPDTESQPAISFNGGILYARDNDVRDVTVRIEPIVSKHVNVDTAILTPYASLPIGVRMRNYGDQEHTTRVAWQLVVGTQLQIEKWKRLQFMTEVGVNLDNALSHFSAAAVYYWDTDAGWVLE